MHFDPRVALALLGYYVFSSAAGAMLPPETGQERSAYGFLFRFVQALAANGHRLVDGHVPELAASAAAVGDSGVLECDEPDRAVYWRKAAGLTAIVVGILVHALVAHHPWWAVAVLALGLYAFDGMVGRAYLHVGLAVLKEYRARHAAPTADTPFPPAPADDAPAQKLDGDRPRPNLIDPRHYPS